MASEPEVSETSFLEHLIRTRNQDLSMFLPLILGFTSPSGRESDEPADLPETGDRPHERIVLINPFTQGMIVIESSQSLEALLRSGLDNKGLPPASKSSIEAMPYVEITEVEMEDGECAICLEEWKIGENAREMPCKHRFHSNCIEKWLGIHGSCPVCRFKMPVDEEDCKKRSGDDERRGRRSARDIWVSFSFNSNNSSDSTVSSTTESNDSSSSRRPNEDAVTE